MLVGGTALAAPPTWSPAWPAAAVLLFALVLGGLGASTFSRWRPPSSPTPTRRRRRQQALSQYNFAGDIGKTLIPGLVGLLLVVLSWQASVTLMGLLGLAAAGCCGGCCRRGEASSAKVASPSRRRQRLNRRFYAAGHRHAGHAVRMGFLTFHRFCSKGAGSAGIG